ncbi:MAG TPA: hypothetical protein VGG57_07240 [Stellaceae bacterium]|jgi:hypothetical protein
MAGSALQEIRTALLGTLILARGDPRGLANFDASLGGFWRSYRAAAISYPIFLALALSRADNPTGRVAIVETIGYVVSWTAFPLVMLNLCRRLGRDDHFLGFMTVYNWCQVPQIVLFSAIAAVEAVGILGGGPAAAVGLAAAAGVLVYEWFVARIALDVSIPVAILVVAIDVALAAILQSVDESLY